MTARWSCPAPPEHDHLSPWADRAPPPRTPDPLSAARALPATRSPTGRRPPTVIGTVGAPPATGPPAGRRRLRTARTISATTTAATTTVVTVGPSRCADCRIAIDAALPSPT